MVRANVFKSVAEMYLPVKRVWLSASVTSLGRLSTGALGSFLRKAPMMSKSSAAAPSPRGLGTDDEEDEAAALGLATLFLTTGALGALRGLAALNGF